MIQKILYIGGLHPKQTSFHRAQALERIGLSVSCHDPRFLRSFFFNKPLISKLDFHSGHRFSQVSLISGLKRLHESNRGQKFDAVWINGGEFLGRQAVRRLRAFAPKLILYNNDDPTGIRDGNRWISLLNALPEYDICAVLREFNVAEFAARGGRNPYRVWMSYDELAHAPVDFSPEPPEMHSDVAFAGAWMPERGPFLARLIERGVPLALWGARWPRAPEWAAIRPAWRGTTLLGDDYTQVIASAKLCLGLLSKGNRDLHTRRSVEIPYAGGLLCAERTSEHLALYKENEEAIFWNDADECADICLRLLNDDAERERIRQNGMRRVRELRLGNEDVCEEILNFATTGRTDTVRPFNEG